MNKVILMLLVGLFFAPLANADNVVYETEWMPSTDLEFVLNEMNSNRLYPCYVQGQVNGIAIQYQASFCPFPQKMNLFQSRWGMSDDWYIETKKQFEAAGFVEHFHSTFLDLSDSVIHQATWVLSGQ